jgi:hypothetical protein
LQNSTKIETEENSRLFTNQDLKFLKRSFRDVFKAKTPLQSRFTLFKSKFFPAKFPFSKIQEKNLAGKIYFAKE